MLVIKVDTSEENNPYALDTFILNYRNMGFRITDSEINGLKEILVMYIEDGHSGRFENSCVISVLINGEEQIKKMEEKNE